MSAVRRHILLTRITAAEKPSAKMKWYELLKYSDGGKPHYAEPGKPKPDAIPVQH
jgi:hypothetical protein